MPYEAAAPEDPADKTWGHNKYGPMTEYSIEDARVLASSLERFSLDLHARVDRPRTNCLLGSSGISLLSLMLHRAAKQPTLDAISQMLCLSGSHKDDPLAVTAAARNLLRLTGDGPAESHPAVFVDRSLQVDPRYSSAIKSSLRGTVSQLDFSDGRSVRDAVNSWADRSTHGLIPSVLDSDPVGMTSLLATATYMKAFWEDPFDEGDPMPFFVQDRPSPALVPSMCRSGYAEAAVLSDGTTAAKLDYRGGLSMLLIMPPKGHPLGDLTRLLASTRPRSLSRIRSELRPNGDTVVTMPKWSFTTSLQDLTSALSDMGLPPASDQDLSAMLSDSSKDIYIDTVLHKARIEVDEVGTEAASVTVAMVGCAAPSPEPPLELTFDRPFFYCIQHDDTQAVLFTGSMRDPALT